MRIAPGYTLPSAASSAAWRLFSASFLRRGSSCLRICTDCVTNLVVFRVKLATGQSHEVK